MIMGDLLEPLLRQKIVRLIELGAVSSLGAAPICSSFSVAVTPPVRSARHPRGIRGLRASMRKKVSDGNSHNDYMADLLALGETRVESFGAVSVASEQAGRSLHVLQQIQLFVG